MRATNGKVALKTVAEGFFIAILAAIRKSAWHSKRHCGTKTRRRNVDYINPAQTGARP